MRRRLTIWAVGTVFGLAMADCGRSSLAPPPASTFAPAPDPQQRACRAARSTPMAIARSGCPANDEAPGRTASRFIVKLAAGPRIAWRHGTIWSFNQRGP